MADKVHKYAGKDIVVTYNVRRCIHAAECIKGLPSVFDSAQRPWINPDASAADKVAEVIRSCPSGALGYQRTDGGAEERVPDINTALVRPGGPLYLRGSIELRDEEGNVLSNGSRMALCRCGESSNKPFCDNSHKKSSFEDTGALGEGGAYVADMDSEDRRVVVTAAKNAYLRVAGPITIIGADGDKRTITKATLCRCGASSSKPFCDSSHRSSGFTS